MNRPVSTITDEQVATLERLGIEVCVRAGVVDELWLVASPTGRDRNEMTFRDAAMLAKLCGVFPEASVTGFQRTTRET